MQCHDAVVMSAALSPGVAAISRHESWISDDNSYSAMVITALRKTNQFFYLTGRLLDFHSQFTGAVQSFNATVAYTSAVVKPTNPLQLKKHLS